MKKCINCGLVQTDEDVIVAIQNTAGECIKMSESCKDCGGAVESYHETINLGRKGDFIGVYNGKKFWPLSPNKEDVDIIGVAHALSQVCRFNGHTRFIWSIAQHSLLVEKIISEYTEYKDNYRVRLIGLLHDASEAYISDLLRPFKKEIKEYGKIEAAVENCILTFCNITDVTDKEWEIVKKADDTALMVEAKVLMNPDEYWTIFKLWQEGFEKYEKDIQYIPNLMVKGRFLMSVGKLVEGMGVTLDWMKEDWYIKARQNNTIPMFTFDNPSNIINGKLCKG